MCYAYWWRPEIPAGKEAAVAGRQYTKEVTEAVRDALGRRLWFYEGMETGDLFTTTTAAGRFRFQYARETKTGVEVTGYGPLGPEPKYRTFRVAVVEVPSPVELADQRAEREADEARARAKKAAA
jgi:hypothetical protein